MNYDLISMGEIMLRLDPGEERIRSARYFRVWEGGGEYNVARALNRCFGLRSAVVSALTDNEVGRLIESLILQGGVSTQYLSWTAFDGIGREARNGLNFTERGYGLRGALSVSDRANSAASHMRRGDVDWNAVFSNGNTAWFHTGGIFASLSDSTAQLTEDALIAARRYGVTVSFDLNYRPSLWKTRGGLKGAQALYGRLMPYVDILLGNEEDFTACLGVEIPGNGQDYLRLNTQGYRIAMEKMAKRYPNVKAIASTLRTVKNASFNDWRALLWMNGQIYESVCFDNLSILDRVGGGDGFASGLIYGLMKSDPQHAVNIGAAHGALSMTTPGDTSMVSLSDVLKVVNGGSARVER